VCRPAYVPADTSDPDREVTCTGTIAAFASLPGGDFELRVTPRPDDARLLAKGQTDILCTIPANRRKPVHQDPGEAEGRQPDRGVGVLGDRDGERARTKCGR
jgi:hypothetical protein